MLKKKNSPSNLPTSFDQWVSENNPPVRLSYGKGWWDYIEILRRLADKFEIAAMDVIGTYVMKTPPPEERLLMPVVGMKTADLELIIKYDFGVFPERWTISVNGDSLKVGSTFGLFDENADLRRETIPGFEPEWLYPRYRESPSRFSCLLHDEWDVAAFVRLVLARDVEHPFPFK